MKSAAKKMVDTLFEGKATSDTSEDRRRAITRRR